MNGNSVLENREIKKHISKAVFPKLFWGILLYIVLLLFNVVMTNFLIIPLVKNVVYLEGEYSQIVIANELYPEYCSEYQFSDLITVSNGTNRNLNTNAYMIQPDDKPPILEQDLKKDEIAISEKTAQKLGLDVGDKAYLELSVFEEPKEYTVVSLIPYCWNYYDVLDNSDFSVIHIGYDENLIQSTAIKIVYYLNDNEYSDYSAKNYSYSNHFDVGNELQAIRIRSIGLIVICIVVSALISGAYLLFLSRRTKQEAVKYHYNGYKAAFVKRIHFIDYLLLYTIPLCLIGLCGAIMSLAIHFVYLYMLAVLLFGLIMVGFVYLKEIRAYGKAYRV